MQVKQWNKQQIVDFWRKWYYPANATLYLFGDFGCSIDEARALIEKSFGKVPAVRQGDSLQPFNPRGPNPYGTMEGTNGTLQLPPPLPRPEVSYSLLPRPSSVILIYFLCIPGSDLNDAGLVYHIYWSDSHMSIWPAT